MSVVPPFDRKSIDQLAAGSDVPKRAIAGLNASELNTLPVGAPGKWTIQQIILHLMDSHTVMGTRVRKIIAEDKPLITAYDETAWSTRLFYERMDAASAAEVFRVNQLMTCDLLRCLPDEAFERQGVHTERGLVTLGSMIPAYVGHLEHHMTFIREKRRLMGKPLAW